MATPSRTGTASQVDASAGDGSTSVTVPSDATGAVAFWAAYDAATFTLSSLTLGGNSFLDDSFQVAGDSDEATQGVAFLNTLPGTGTQTLAWTYSNGNSARDEGGWIVIVWVKDTNSSDPTRDMDADNQPGSTPPSVTIDSATDDFVLGAGQSFNTSTPDITGTEFINNAALNSELYDVSEVTPGASTTTVTVESGYFYSSIAAISLKAQSAEPPPDAGPKLIVVQANRQVW